MVHGLFHKLKDYLAESVSDFSVLDLMSPLLCVNIPVFSRPHYEQYLTARKNGWYEDVRTKALLYSRNSFHVVWEYLGNLPNTS